MVDVKAMGFPTGWETELLWDWRRIVKDEKWYNKILNL